MSDWNLPWRDGLLILPVIGFVSVAKIEVLSGPLIRNGSTEAEDLAVEAVACTACGETLVVYGRACGCMVFFIRTYHNEYTHARIFSLILSCSLISSLSLSLSLSLSHIFSLSLSHTLTFLIVYIGKLIILNLC